jgi:hypothetical protein
MGLMDVVIAMTTIDERLQLAWSALKLPKLTGVEENNLTIYLHGHFIYAGITQGADKWCSWKIVVVDVV